MAINWSSSVLGKLKITISSAKILSLSLDPFLEESSAKPGPFKYWLELLPNVLGVKVVARAIEPKNRLASPLPKLMGIGESEEKH